MLLHLSVEIIGLIIFQIKFVSWINSSKIFQKKLVNWTIHQPGFQRHRDVQNAYQNWSLFSQLNTTYLLLIITVYINNHNKV